MGYSGESNSVTSGIHMRQFARAFIIDDNLNRVAFVNVDCHSIDQIIKLEVKYIVVLTFKWCHIYASRRWEFSTKLVAHVICVLMYITGDDKIRGDLRQRVFDEKRFT